MPTFSSTEIINHLATTVPTRHVSTDVNNIVMEQQKSRRNKIKYYECKVLHRNETARKRLKRKLIIKKVAEAKKKAEAKK